MPNSRHATLPMAMFGSRAGYVMPGRLVPVIDMWHHIQA